MKQSKCLNLSLSPFYSGIFALSLVSLPIKAMCDEGPIIVEGRTVRDQGDDENSSATTETIAINHNDDSLGAMLQDATGADVHRTGNQGRGEYVQLRGTRSHQLQVHLDDFPIVLLQAQGLDLSSMPTALFDEVMIVRGGSSVDYGSGAQGGIVRLRVNKNRHRPNEYQLRLGSFGYKRLNLLRSVRRSRGALRTGLQLEQSNGDFSFQDDNGRRRKRVNNGHLSFNAFSTGDWNLQNGGRLKLLIETYQSRREEPGPMEFPNMTARSKVQRLIGGLILTPRTSLNGRFASKIISTIQLRHSQFTDPVPAYAGDPNRFALNDVSFASVYRAKLQLTSTLFLGSSFDTQSTRIETRTNSQRRSQRQISGATVHTEFSPLSSVVLTSGLRLQSNEQKPELLPRLGIRSDMSESVSLSLNVSRFIRVPNLDELYHQGIGVSGNPDLNAETGYSAEVGFSYQRVQSDYPRLSLTTFVTHFDSLIFFAPIDAYRYQSQNHSGGQVYGSETRLEHDVLTLKMMIAHKFQISASNGDAGRPLPYRPAHRTRLLVSRVFEKLTSTLGFSHVSSQSIDGFGVRSLPGFGEVDAQLTYTPTRFLGISLNGNNLLNGLTHKDFPTLPRPGRSITFVLSFYER